MNANYTGRLGLFDEIAKDAMQPCPEEPIAQFGLSSPTPDNFNMQPAQQGLNSGAGAQMQPQGASILPIMNGVAGHQQNEGMGTLMPVDLDIDFIVDERDISSLLPPNVTNDPESPYIGQWKRIEQLMQNGSQSEKNKIDRMWIETRDPLFNSTLRREFALCIERMRWDLIDPADNDEWGQSYRIADTLKLELHDKIMKRLRNFLQDNPAVHYQLQRWANTLADPFASSLNVIRPIKTVLDKEKKIIDSRNRQGVQCVNAIGQDMQNLTLQLDPQLAQISATSDKLSELERVSQESCRQVQELIMQVQKLQVRLQGQLRFVDKFNRAGLCLQELQGINALIQNRDLVIQKEMTVLRKYSSSVDNLRIILLKVLDNDIKEYQRNAAYIACGKLESHYLTLDKLQEWVKRLAKLVSSNLQQMDKLSRLEQELGLDFQPQLPNGATSMQTINELNRNYRSMIESLVQKGLVIEKHPPQVLMKGKRFQSWLRHLVGDALDINTITFRVKAYIINGRQVAKVLQEGPTSTFEEGGEIINRDEPSDYNPQTGLLAINMRTMCLKMSQRGTQRNETVAQQKFAMLFRTEITVRNRAQHTKVAAQALSLPIVVISHGKQEADAQATILWDNAFADINRRLFEVDTSVPWWKMFDALNSRWKVECRDDSQNGVGLNEEAKKYLTRRLFNRDEVPSETMISWNQFNLDKMIMQGSEGQRHPFTFWTWFYKVMELCSCKHIKEYWNKKLIHGFLSKEDCRDMLLRASRGRKPGTFMFRFSESQLAAVSISYSTVNKKNGRIEVQHYSPDTTDEFRVRSLPDMLRDLKHLHYLYPDQPKDKVFGSYYEKAVVPCHPSPRNPYLPKPFVVSSATNVDSLEPGTGLESSHLEFPVSSHAAGSLRENGVMDEDSNWDMTDGS